MLHLIFALLSLALAKSCVTDQDCRLLFCDGLRSTCNVTAGACIRATEPCLSIRQDARHFSSLCKHTVSILCLESLRQCVELYYCVTDDDCGLSAHCNDGQCSACGVFSKQADDDGADPTRVYITVAAVTLFLAVGVFFTLVVICQWHVIEKRIWKR